jgi:hypothetical protein
VTDALLFLHLLSAAAIFAAVVASSAIVLGARLGLGATRLFVVVWQAGIVGVLIFGIALAIDIDGYQPWDVWVLIAIVLWFAAGGTADRLSAAYREAGGEGAALPAGIAGIHWVHVGLVLLLLADMVWKPWA